MAGMAMPLSRRRSAAQMDGETGDPVEIEHAAVLGHWLSVPNANPEAVAAAWERIDQVFADPHARLLGIELGLMARAVGRTAGFEAQRSLVLRAVDAGLQPDLDTFQALLQRMEVEGFSSADVHACYTEMRSLGLRPNGAIDRIISRPDAELDALRASVLHSHLDPASMERHEWLHRASGTTSTGMRLRNAWRLFDGYLERGVARTSHLNVMLSGACASCDHQAELVARARRHDVLPNVITYTTLTYTRNLEGREITSVLAECVANGIRPDSKLEAEVHVSAGDLSRRRTTQLRRWLLDGGARGRQDSWSLFNTLVANEAADTYQLGVMLSYASPCPVWPRLASPHRTAP